MSFVLGDQRYTVAYLDRPQNPKEARFSERDYGRFGSYFVADATEKKPVEVDYRLWLQDGPMTVEPGRGQERGLRDAAGGQGYGGEKYFAEPGLERAEA